MTDAGLTIPGDALLRSKEVANGLGARLAEQVSIEADRVSGTIEGGVRAAKAASLTYGNLFTDGYTRMVRGSMRGGAEFGEHLAALMRARTPFEVFELNGAFLQRQASAMPARILEMMGLGAHGPEAGDGRG